MPAQNPTPEDDLNGKLTQFLAQAENIRQKLDAMGAKGEPARLFAQSIDEIRKQTERLQETIGSARKSFREKYFKDAGSIVLSVLALILTGLNFGYTYFWLSPDIRLSGGPNIKISYSPDRKILHLDWKVVVANFGRKMDLINWAQAKLTSPDVQTSTPIELPQSTLVLQMRGGERVFTPFVVKDNSAIEFDVGAEQVLGKDTFGSFFDASYFGQVKLQRQEELVVSFSAEHRKVDPRRLCFSLSSDDLLTLQKGQVVTTDLDFCKGK